MPKPIPPRPIIFKSPSKAILLAAEFAILFIAIPLLLFAFGTRLAIYLSLWGAGLYAFAMLYTAPGFSWRKLWEGDGWSHSAKRIAFIRFLLVAVLIAGATWLLVPQRFMRFPLDRFPLWCAVMVIYPILSIIPQELFFRSFYFARYRGVVAEKWSGILINGLLFGFSHIILSNWVAPTFCAIGGVIIAYHYRQHRSLKWAVVEHTLYGNWVFTVGIGYYFFTGNWRH